LLSEEEEEVEERRKRAQETIGYMHLSVWIIALRKTKIIFRRNQQKRKKQDIIAESDAFAVIKGMVDKIDERVYIFRNYFAD